MQSLLLWQFTYLLKPASSSQLWIVFPIFPSSQRGLYLLTTENTWTGAKSQHSCAFFFYFLPLFHISATNIKKWTFIITVYQEATAQLTDKCVCLCVHLDNK